MHEAGQETWFYTREGERIGPVSFTMLREKAASAALDPRLDMAWTSGMAEWKPAGEIDGLFEKRSATPEPQETLASTAEPHTPQNRDTVADMMSKEADWPGARRRSFIFMTFIFPLIWGFIFSTIGSVIGPQLGPEIMRYIGFAAGLLPAILGIYFFLIRLVNLGMSRWWFLAALVPLLNFWVGYRCFACPPGYAYHKKLDGIGVALTIFYWLSFLLVLAATAAMVFLMINEVGNPALQELLNKLPATLRERMPKP